MGPCPDLGQELSPPGNSGPSATELQHVSWLVASAESLNLTMALPPSALCVSPWAKVTPGPAAQDAAGRWEAHPYTAVKLPGLIDVMSLLMFG